MRQRLLHNCTTLCHPIHTPHRRALGASRLPAGRRQRVPATPPVAPTTRTLSPLRWFYPHPGPRRPVGAARPDPHPWPPRSAHARAPDEGRAPSPNHARPCARACAPAAENVHLRSGWGPTPPAPHSSRTQPCMLSNVLPAPPFAHKPHFRLTISTSASLSQHAVHSVASGSPPFQRPRLCHSIHTPHRAALLLAAG